ncbi:MAG TPA: MerR family transcriptional regulator [Fimbriimonas sp.]|nr:MerR family transcriptional regulator [Fimbriimonas sp.]
MESSYTIKALAQETGVSAFTIRAWEKRYGALTPSRTDTNRRRYSQSDVERLKALDRAVQAGHAIGAIAGLNSEQLAQLSKGAVGQVHHASASDVVEECFRLIRNLEASELGATLRAAADEFGTVAFVQDILAPITKRVGDGWHQGTISISQEHVSTAVIRGVLDQLRVGFVSRKSAPTLVATTPPNQRHELGAMMIATVAASVGWRSVYLGADMPWSDIGEAITKTKARVLAFSIVMPMDASEQKKMAGFVDALPAHISVLFGGRSSASLPKEAMGSRGLLLQSIPQLASLLEDLKTVSTKK